MVKEELKNMSNGLLLAELDDLVQQLAKLNCEEWLVVSRESGFLEIKRELASRLGVH